MIDTLIVEKDNEYFIEKYQGQNLDEYDHISELDHNNLLNYKAIGCYFMKTITIKQILEYMQKEFGYKI